MLPASESSRTQDKESVRLATTDDYDRFFAAADWNASSVNRRQALEESFFLGLRLNGGVDLNRLREEFGTDLNKYKAVTQDFLEQGVLVKSGTHLMLTRRGRLLSNEVFQRFIAGEDLVREIDSV
jgi:oxygen-independent coproporphyrinogen-3 oxidase